MLVAATSSRSLAIAQALTPEGARPRGRTLGARPRHLRGRGRRHGSRHRTPGVHRRHGRRRHRHRRGQGRSSPVPPARRRADPRLRRPHDRPRRRHRSIVRAPLVRSSHHQWHGIREHLQLRAGDGRRQSQPEGHPARIPHRSGSGPGSRNPAPRRQGCRVRRPVAGHGGALLRPHSV